MHYSTDLLKMILIILVIFIVFVIFIFNLLPILEERRQIKMEIARSSGKERIYWERKLKKLYLKIFKW